MFEQTLTRRAALERLSAGTLLALGWWPGALRAADDGRSGSFRFLVVNDLHYMTSECGVWLEKAMRQMKAHPGVEFCLVAGDLCEHGTAEELAGARDALKVLGLPTYVVVGNHDYLGENPVPNAKAGRPRARTPRDAGPEPPRSQRMANRRAYETHFPSQINYWFEHRGWQFVGLDTSQGLRYEKTVIQDPTFWWIDAHVSKLDRRKPTVIVTHFPLGPTVRYRPANADALLERFKPLNLQAVFCGHWHGFTERQVDGVTLTTNRCCALKRGNHDGSKEKGYFLCAAQDGKITREFVPVQVS